MLKGSKNTKPLYKKPWFIGWFIGLILAALVCICIVCLLGGTVDTSPIPSEEIDYLYSEPDDYAGRTVQLTGRVFNIEKDGDTTIIQLYHDVENYNQDAIVLTDDQDVKIKENEYIRVDGSVDGEFNGENVMGGEIACPQISATKIEQIDVTEAIPAEKTVKVNETITRGKYKATVEKVDFTGQNVRVYLKVKNGSSKDFSNYPIDGKLIQGGKQYEVEYDGNYPYPSTSVKPGASSESVIVFKGVEQSNFKYTFIGYDTNYDEMEFNFNIEVK